MSARGHDKRFNTSEAKPTSRPVKSKDGVESDESELLDLLVTGQSLSSNQLKDLVCKIDTHDVIAKVFILEGTPYVFEQSPMKYMIFREQVAERFDVGYQDICIVGSAKLGFSPSAHKFGTIFAESSDVDVVIISEAMFDQGTQALFKHLNTVGPLVPKNGSARNHDSSTPMVKPSDWKSMKEAVRNYTYQNFNPALLPSSSDLKMDIFQKIGSTAPLFLALEPKVFVSKIRCRFFRNWRAAEGYYSNSLRQLAYKLRGEAGEIDEHFDDDEG